MHGGYVTENAIVRLNGTIGGDFRSLKGKGAKCSQIIAL